MIRTIWLFSVWRGRRTWTGVGLQTVRKWANRAWQTGFEEEKKFTHACVCILMKSVYFILYIYMI